MEHRNGKLDRELFRVDPCRFIESAIQDYVRTSPLNHLTFFDNAPIIEDPVVGFADGADPVFLELKAVIGEFHLAPREIMEKYIVSKRWQFGARSLDRVGVIGHGHLPAAGVVEARAANPGGRGSLRCR